jgi:hypothetical protein
LNTRVIRRIALALAAAGCLFAIPIAAQNFITKSVCPDDNPAVFRPCALAAARAFTPSKTPDGKPDLSGLWRRRSAAFEDLEAHPKNPDDGGGPSVVVDPADGKVPMQPWADARRLDNAAKYLHHNAACLPAGTPGTMYMSGLYNIDQTSSTIAIIGEQLSPHPYRSIPLDGRAHVGSGITLWNGDSRGRWDGNTLVIDTTNQNGRNYLDQRGRFYTEQAHVVERFTPVDADTLLYEATIDDANVYTRSFTIAFPFRRNALKNAEVWEEACYEANESQMILFRNNGFKVYPGITAAEAKELRRAWETKR